jgi:uncharacterized LabA/DUF88 family protein
MFKPKTDRIKKLADKYPDRITELQKILHAPTNIYIDYANVRPWSEKLGWHVDPKRLKQFLDSFDTIQSIKFYQGTLVGDAESERFIKEVTDFGYEVKTKPVKIMRHSINVSSIPTNSPDILKNFIRWPLLKNLKLEAVEYLNNQLRELNKAGQTHLEDRKCNFDVEIGRDILLDYGMKVVECFVLWSGDSDFADPLEQLLTNGKTAYVFATARRVASELNALKGKGLLIYDIQKIRDFICWKKEMSQPL